MQYKTLENTVLKPLGLNELAEDDIEYLLSIIVKKNDHTKKYYFKDHTFNEYSYCQDINKKIIYEIKKRINFIINHEKINDDEQNYTVVFEKYYKNKIYFPLTRTLRMLLFLEAILTKKFDTGQSTSPSYTLNKSFNIDWNIIFNKDSVLFQYGQKGLIQDIYNIKETTIPLKDNFSVSLPVLLIISIFYSQSEAYRPVFWESYSAKVGRAEIQKKFQFLDRFEIQESGHTLLEFVIDLVTLLIRYQSDPGQRVRSFGDFKYCYKVDWLINEKYKKIIFSRDILHSIFNLLAIIEEARNHRLPLLPETDNSDNSKKTKHLFDINEGVNAKWDFNQLSIMLENLYNINYEKNSAIEKTKKKYEKSRGGFQFRWAYARSLTKNISTEEKQQVYTFLKLTEQYVINKINQDRTESKQHIRKKIAQFSFGRDQSHNLGTLILNNITSVMNKTGKPVRVQRFAEEFEKTFYYQELTIPDPFHKNIKYKELVIKIKLKDYIAAPHLIFDEQTANIFNIHSTSRVKKVLREQNNENIDVCTLFRYLYIRTKDKFNLKADRLNRQHSMYFPVPLFKRILKVIYRLQPGKCITIPLQIKKKENNFQSASQNDANKTNTLFVSFPRGLQKDNDTDIEIVKCLANYVWANVQNKAMSEGLVSGDIILEELDKLSGHQEKSQKKNKNCIDKEYLIKEIEEAKKYNSYHLLTEKYLTDYNKERENIKTIFQPEIQSLKPLSITKLKALLKNQLEINSKNGKSKNNSLIYLGIDIGGTFIKIQFFEFVSNGENNRFRQIGEKFRLLTKQKDIEKYAQPEKEISSQEFVKSIIERINSWIFRDADDEMMNKLKKNQIHAIGITWPGPVRDNKVSGTSGILQQFYPLSRNIPQNQIEDIWKLNIVDTFKKEWKKNFCFFKEHMQQGKKPPFVSLVNDGDAEGMGAVAYPIFEDKKKSNNPENNTEKDKTLIVIKMGTGTAGAIFKDESLVKNLNEWGKIILDLGAHPLLCKTQKVVPYPVGTVNHYLSQKTMPRLATEFNENFNQIEQLDSLEIGLILNVGKINIEEIKKNHDKGRALIRLIEQCGIREYIVSQKSEISEKVNFEVLQRILDNHKKNKKGDPELEEILQKFMQAFRKAAIEKLVDAIYIYGTLRLAKILKDKKDKKFDNENISQFLLNVLFENDCNTLENKKKDKSQPTDAENENVINPDFIYSKDFVKELSNQKQKTDEEALLNNFKEISHKLNNIYDECKKYAEIMGIYLGDFIAQLYDQYKMDQIILSGGVLSDKTRDFILTSAQNRLNRYNIHLFSRKNVTIQGNMKNIIELKHNEINNGRDFGCYGSAIYAANECIYQAQKDGLLDLKNKLLNLAANSTIEITTRELILKEKEDETKIEIDFNNSLLDKNNTSDFIKSIGTDFNIILSKPGKEKDTFIKLS